MQAALKHAQQKLLASPIMTQRKPSWRTGQPLSALKIYQYSAVPSDSVGVYDTQEPDSNQTPFAPRRARPDKARERSSAQKNWTHRLEWDQ